MIRRAGEDDIPRIVELVGHFIDQTSYGSLFSFSPPALEELVAVVLQLGVIFLADEGGTVVGLLAATAITEPIGQQRIAEEMAWWVEPAYRHSSVGPRLLDAVEAWARVEGLALVKMVAPADQPQVGEYYRRRGYAPVETSWVRRL